MRLIRLTSLTMIAFAGNSILNRMALAGGHIEAAPFASVRLVAGALTLALLCIVLRGGLRLGGPARAIGVGALLVYIYAFSAAYTALDAGLGALILFGMVQITMFTAGLLARDPVSGRRWIGAVLACVGLGWLLWPGPGAVLSPGHGALMALAGIAWGLYSLAGRQATDALGATAANFVLAVPPGLALGFVLPAPSEGVAMSGTGITLAIASGAITSGLGYALWYSVLPGLDRVSAAVAQLSVPVIALVGGVLLLNEGLSLPLALASALVLTGIAISVIPVRSR